MKKVFYLFVIASLGFTSCASFDHINSYSKTAVQGIEESDDINLSFTNICQQYSRSAFQYSIRINPTIVKPIPSCDDEILADSILKIYHDITIAYLVGLNKLSNGDLTNFNLEGLANNLKDLKGKTNITSVSDDQIAAAQSITANLLKWAFDIMRAVRLKKVITATDAPLHKVLDAYKLSLLALKGRIKQAKNDYNTFVFADANLGILAASTNFEKNKVIKDRDAFYAVCDKEMSKVDAYINVINSIEVGHKELATLSPNLQAVAVKDMINQATGQIQSMDAEFKKLTKK